MQPAKRLSSSPLGLCGAPAGKVPAPPLPRDEPNTSSLLKAFEAVVAAGRRGLLGPTAKAAVEAMPDADLEGSDGKAGQETPNPVPLVEEKKGEGGEGGGKKRRRKRKRKRKRQTRFAYNCYTPPVAGTESSKPYRKEIWIIGDSVIWLLIRRAQLSHSRIRLDSPSCTSYVTLRGVPEMMWDDLLPILHNIYLHRPFPSFIIIHLGGNDIWRDSSSSLATKMQNDLNVLQRALSGVVLIWSSLLPKPFCIPSEKSQDIESKRHNVNSEMEEYCAKNSICYLSHPLFTVENKALFGDNALSNEGADTFASELNEILHASLIYEKC